MPALTLDGIEIPVSSVSFEQRLPYSSVSRSGRVRKYHLGKLEESISVDLGPLGIELGLWLMARLTDSDAWAFDADEWSAKGYPSGFLIASVPSPVGSNCAYLASATPLPGNWKDTATFSYWHSNSGSTWNHYVQTPDTCLVDGLPGAPKITNPLSWNMAAGYYAGLVCTANTLPTSYLTQLTTNFPGRGVILGGDIIEVAGTYGFQIENLNYDLSKRPTISVQFYKL